MEVGSIADWVSGVATALAVWLAYWQYTRESKDRIKELKRQNQQREYHLTKVAALVTESQELERILQVFLVNARKNQRLDERELDRITSKAVVFDNKLRLLLPSISLAVSPVIYTFKSILLDDANYRRFRLASESALSQIVMAIDTTRDIAEVIKSVGGGE